MSAELSFERMAPIYNDAVNAALAKLYLGDAAKADEIAALSDAEFIDMRLTGSVQPINPASALAKGMGAAPEDVTSPEINEFLYEAWQKVQRDYAEHDIDPMPSIEAAANIISHTEAYITGYSREIGVLAARIAAVDPSFTGPTRWHAKTWVVDEDIHDRAAQLQNQATGMLPPHNFFDEHRVHMVKGIHVRVKDPIRSTAFLTTQEGVTVPSYVGEGILFGPELGILPGEVRTNEAQHFNFYRRVIGYMLDHFPDETVTAIYEANVDFEMPGKEGIPDYEVKSMKAALAGVLDPAKVLTVQRNIIRQLHIADRQFTSDTAKQAQEALIDPAGQFGEKALQRAERGLNTLRRRVIRRAREEGTLLPAIVGVTVDKDTVTHEMVFPEAA